MKRFLSAHALLMVVAAVAGAPTALAAEVAPAYGEEVRRLTRNLAGPVLVASWEDAASKGMLDQVAMIIGTMGKPIIARRQALLGNPGESEPDTAVRLCATLSLGGVVIVGSSTAADQLAGPPLAVYACALDPRIAWPAVNSPGGVGASRPGVHKPAPALTNLQSAGKPLMIIGAAAAAVGVTIIFVTAVAESFCLATQGSGCRPPDHTAAAWVSAGGAVAAGTGVVFRYATRF